MKNFFTAAILLFSILLCYQNVFAEKVFVPELIEAVWKNDASRVELLIKQGANVNVAHEDTVLVEAVRSKNVNIEIVKLLLNAKKIDVNKYSTRPMGGNSWHRTPLIAAVEAGHVEAVKLLLAKGAKVNLADQYFPTSNIIGPEPLNTALHYAAEKGFYDIAELLINKGANIEQLNSTGITPLIASVYLITNESKAIYKENSVKTAALLLDRGAKVDNCAFSPNTKFLKIDLPEGAPSTINPNVIVRGGGGITPLYYVALNGFVEGAKLLIDRGAKIGFQHYTSKATPIMAAATGDKTEMVRLLLDRGANIESADVLGTNSLLLASIGLKYNTVSLLLERKANVNAFVNTTGDNALMYAINQSRKEKEKDSIRMMNLLIDGGININFQGPQGNTALMYASGWGVVTKNPERARILLDKGAKVNLQNKKGETALMMAAYRGHVETAKLLIDRGANIELKDAAGRTALMTASAATIDLKDNNSDFPELVKLLLDKGANINAKDKNNSTALSLAKKNGHKKIVAVLSAKGGTTDASEKKDESGKAIVGIWEGMQNSNPYDLHRFTFKSDNTWTYEIKATAMLLKQFPKSQHKVVIDSYKDRAKQQGDKGTYSFREQYLVLKTNSFFSPDRVFGWSVQKGKLHLNGTEFILSKVSK
ncbi:MAG TPA: ankyrin repeat domain-containing protein [Spirochaetota bacterium]|nr:ankyrin repeat domain-containing protein [Spirochaetota bacterium]